ncbi:APC family permease [Pontibaca salina]|uniref:APC family permease n=1 Tax=Pontibaca salina TaxID=2795731 RepID=A0A934HS89_9RHOB|nr:APC family permease [Pontibaca salina]MBI6630842.1 APC family permease [Pontibaca salina]
MTSTVEERFSAPPLQLHRTLDWRAAFWLASGVPALVLFTIGGVAGVGGTLTFIIFATSITFGLIQSLTYAEIAGLFPSKSGGASVYGSIAWLRYAKPVAPLSVWCNWLAWTPGLSLGCTIAAAYILNALAPIPAFTASSAEVINYLSLYSGASLEQAIAAVTADATPAIRTWTLYKTSFGPVSISLNGVFWIGVVLCLLSFAIQHGGILRAAKFQKYMGLLVIVPMLIVGIAPIVTGQINWSNYTPLAPLAEAYAPEIGAWSVSGWTLLFGGLFLAGYSAYAFETSICYTSEFKNPGRDTVRAILYSGILCLVVTALVPFTFQGVLGLDGMLAEPIGDGSGVAEAMAKMVGGSGVVTNTMIMLMILAVMLLIMTAMAGSSRTLYQGAVDGWLPKYLTRVNEHGAPTAAMWTDLVFNLFLLTIAAADAASFFFVMAVSNCCYFIFNFLNLNSGWIHRIDNGKISRPWKAPTIAIVAGTSLSFVNAMLMGAGAKVWHPHALYAGFIAAFLILPVFYFRHYIQDKGKFPEHMLQDIGLTQADLKNKKAGILPYIAIAGGLMVMLTANWFFVL